MEGFNSQKYGPNKLLKRERERIYLTAHQNIINIQKQLTDKYNCTIGGLIHINDFFLPTNLLMKRKKNTHIIQ